MLQPAEGEQVSLFARISAVPLGDASAPDWALDEGEPDEPEPDHDLPIPLPPLPTAVRLGATRTPEGRTLREHKQHLREANAGRARDIARHTGLTHAEVNGELNRLAGLRKVSEATVGGASPSGAGCRAAGGGKGHCGRLEGQRAG